MLRLYDANGGYAKNASLSRVLAGSKLAPGFRLYVRSYVGIPLRLIADGTNDIAGDFAGGDARAKAARGAQRCRGMNLGDGLTETRDLNGLSGFQHLLEYSKAGGLEFRDGDVVHVVHENSLDYGPTIVNKRIGEQLGSDLAVMPDL